MRWQQVQDNGIVCKSCLWQDFGCYVSFLNHSCAQPLPFSSCIGAHSFVMKVPHVFLRMTVGSHTPRGPRDGLYQAAFTKIVGRTALWPRLVVQDGLRGRRRSQSAPALTRLLQQVQSWTSGVSLHVPQWGVCSSFLSCLATKIQKIYTLSWMAIPFRALRTTKAAGLPNSQPL